jgi:hypothetical protein
MLLSPVEHAFANEDWLRNLRIGDATVGGLLEQQLRIGYRRDPATGALELVPHTPAALKLLTGPNAARTTAVLQAMRGAVHVGRQRPQDQGISISETYEGFLLNTLIDWIQLGGHDPMSVSYAAALKSPEARPRFQQIVSDWVETNEANATFATWVNVWRRTGAVLRSLFEGTPASQIDPKIATIASAALGHELQHAITPARGDDYDNPDGSAGKLRWLEEGGAEFTTKSMGIDRAIAQALGLRYDPALREDDYVDWVDAYRRMTVLAGIDATTPAGALRAGETLQDGALSRAPGRFARAIAQQHGIPDSLVEQLRVLIRDSGGTAANVTAIEQWVAGHGHP